MATMVGTIGMGGQREGQSHVHSAAVACERNNVAKNVALFFAAPFIGLAYIIALPVVGMVTVLKAVCR